MLVYLLRHGIAAERGTMTDEERPLTEEGWRKMRLEAAAIQTLGLRLDVVFTSPLIRARETAQAVLEAYPTPPELVVAETLAPEQGFGRSFDERSPIVEEIGRRQFQRAMLVGHEPDLSELASGLLLGRLNLHLDFKKGALCALRLDRFAPRASNSLLWLLAPQQLRLIAASREA